MSNLIRLNFKKNQCNLSNYFQKKRNTKLRNELSYSCEKSHTDIFKTLKRGYIFSDPTSYEGMCLKKCP